MSTSSYNVSTFPPLLPSLFAPSQNNLGQQDLDSDHRTSVILLPRERATTTDQATKITAIAAQKSSPPRILENDSLLLADAPVACDILGFMEDFMKTAMSIARNLMKLCNHAMEYSKTVFEAAMQAALKNLRGAVAEFAAKMTGCALSSGVMLPALGKMASGACSSLYRFVKKLPPSTTPENAYQKVTELNTKMTAVGFLSNVSNSSGEMSGAVFKEEAAQWQAFMEYIGQILDNNKRFFDNQKELQQKMRELYEEMNRALATLLYLNIK